MKTLKFLMAAFALVMSSLAVAAPAAAQGTKIVVVDQGRVLRESKAGQDIAQKIQTIEQQMQRELEPTAKSLETMGKSLETKSANMTPEAMRADAALRQEAQDFRNRLQGLSQERDKRAAELQLTERQASVAFSKALGPVLEEVMNEEGAQIMLGASDVMVAKPETDVTSKVISKLDARAPTIAVSRQRIPEQTAQQ